MSRDDSSRLNPEQARRIAEDCYGEVLAYCRRHAPTGHEAADLTQETFLRFVRAQGYRERGKPIAYLMRIARSVCVDASRERRLETVSLDFEPAAKDCNANAGAGVLQDADVVAPLLSGGAVGLDANQRIGACDAYCNASDLGLDAALMKLPDELREAVELRFGAELGVGEVAWALGISRFAARRRINAALKLLKRELAGQRLREKDSEEGGFDG